jgi:hypothetical protein
MNGLFHKVCVLVTAAFVLTLLPGFLGRQRSLLSMRDQGTALLMFLVLGWVEEATAWRTGWLNEHIVAVCAAGPAAMTPVLQGLGTALILAVVAQVRDRDEQARVAAEAEVRALQAHALGLLRRRLHGLFGRAFRLEVDSEVGQGTTVTIRIPLRTQGGLGKEAREALTVSRAPLASS